jgi:hypothetical protein
MYQNNDTILRLQVNDDIDAVHKSSVLLVTNKLAEYKLESNAKTAEAS